MYDAFKAIIDYAEGKAVTLHVHINLTGNGDRSQEPPTLNDSEDPVYIFQQPEGNQAAPVRETLVKGNGNLEPGEKEIGQVHHGDQVLLLAFPEPLAGTVVKADWWYVYVVGRTVTGWVRRKETRNVVERTSSGA